jgi:uncharacterized membrane protein YraQ (UPF0718 family)
LNDATRETGDELKRIATLLLAGVLVIAFILSAVAQSGA